MQVWGGENGKRKRTAGGRGFAGRRGRGVGGSRKVPRLPRAAAAATPALRPPAPHRHIARRTLVAGRDGAVNPVLGADVVGGGWGGRGQERGRKQEQTQRAHACQFRALEPTERAWPARVTALWVGKVIGRAAEWQEWGEEGEWRAGRGGLPRGWAANGECPSAARALTRSPTRPPAPHHSLAHARPSKSQAASATNVRARAAAALPPQPSCVDLPLPDPLLHVATASVCERGRQSQRARCLSLGRI